MSGEQNSLPRFAGSLELNNLFRYMDLDGFKKQVIRDRLEIGKEYGRIFSFVDFANVNNWFAHDRQDSNDRPLAYNEYVDVDIDKLKAFADLVSERTRLYYGENPTSEGSESL